MGELNVMKTLIERNFGQDDKETNKQILQSYLHYSLINIYDIILIL